MLVATGSLSFCCFVLFGVRQLYIFVIGPFRGDQERTILNLFLEQNPILHISIIFMTDPNIIPQKFDLAIWLCFYFTFSTFKIYHNICNQQLQMILQNISDDYQEELKCIIKLQRFSAVLFLINMWICTAGLWLFSFSGYYRLSLLFYEGILFGFDSFKMIICTTKLRDHMNFYVNYNTEEVHDPFFKRETLFDSFYHIVQLFHFSQLIYNYFFKLDFQFIMHLWLLYLFKKINISLRQLKNNFLAYRRYQSIQTNLDIMFPRVDIKELTEGDVCSICHDELLVARRIETCGHKFHIKCLFKWLKSQQNSRCPICRSEIPNLNFDNTHNKPGIFTSVIDYIARVFSPTINFIFEQRNTQNENINGNNQNQNNNDNDNDMQDISELGHHEQFLQQLTSASRISNNRQDFQQTSDRAQNPNNYHDDQHESVSLGDLLNQNYYDNDERDLQMYQQISNLVFSSALGQEQLQNSQQQEARFNFDRDSQNIRNHIMQVIKQNYLNNQIKREEDVEQIDNNDNEYEQEGEESENQEFEDGYQNEQDQELSKEMTCMKSSEESLLNLKDELLNLQDSIIKKGNNVNTDAILQHFQKKLEKEQKNLINFLTKKLLFEEQVQCNNKQQPELEQDQTRLLQQQFNQDDNQQDCDQQKSYSQELQQQIDESQKQQQLINETSKQKDYQYQLDAQFDQHDKQEKNYYSNEQEIQQQQNCKEIDDQGHDSHQMEEEKQDYVNNLDINIQINNSQSLANNMNVKKEESDNLKFLNEYSDEQVQEINIDKNKMLIEDNIARSNQIQQIPFNDQEIKNEQQNQHVLTQNLEENQQIQQNKQEQQISGNNQEKEEQIIQNNQIQETVNLNENNCYEFNLHEDINQIHEQSQFNDKKQNENIQETLQQEHKNTQLNQIQEQNINQYQQNQQQECENYQLQDGLNNNNKEIETETENEDNKQQETQLNQ